MKATAFLLIALTAMDVAAQPVASRLTSKADQELLTALVAAEDSRSPSLDGTDPRRRGLTSSNAFLRAFTLRGLGRLEEPYVIPAITPLLFDPSAEVRAAAADALAQSAARALPANTDAAVRGRFTEAATSARAALVPRLSAERDPAVRAALLEAVGRLNQGSVERLKETARLIAPSLNASAVERRGAIRGLFFLARKREARPAGAIPTEVTDAMYTLLGVADPALTPTDRYNIAYALVGAFATDQRRAQEMIADRDPGVRERGVVAVGRVTDTAFVRDALRRARSDAAPVVRFRSVATYAQRLRTTDGCAPLLQLARDADMTVALAATDALSGCRNDGAAVRLLDSLASGFRDDDRWHLPAHAFVSLSAVNSARARELMSSYAGARGMFARMYADAAARSMNDTATLRRLARDPAPNVRASAIEGLSKLIGHAGDALYLQALTSEDNQLLMSASAALAGSPDPTVEAKAKEAVQRLRALRRETTRDGEDALTGLIRALTGGTYYTSPMARDVKPLPTFSDLAAIEQSTATIEMADGAVITMRFHPFDAPTNAARFVRLARAGTFDGLTFHRVAPFFVVQGPGPEANEYSAPDGPFARDELAVSNVRGTVGLSTRGRDTADGQIYINTVDNVWLDHEYTVMATIVSGLEAFDRMQEGARIRKITIR